jgi:hypothetical protein
MKKQLLVLIGLLPMLAIAQDVKAYGVGSIPANFLIDPSGKIIATNLRGIYTFWDLARLVQPVKNQDPK